MDKNDLFKSIGQIDEQTLINAEVSRKRKAVHGLRLIAACLAVVLVAFGFSYLFHTDRSVSKWFVITAQAAEGDWNRLEMNEGFFNSGGTGHGIFPADVPLFHFVIQPSDWNNYENEYGKFEVVVSYNGKKVESLDDHVVVFVLYPLYGSNASYEYDVTGWFEEPTDVTITIVDKTTDKIIEEQTVNVCYDTSSEAYRLTVTDVQTYKTTK